MGQEKKKCLVEQVIFQEKDRNTMSLPKQIFQRPDLMLVAAGSLSCLRALYLQAAALGKLHQFYVCNVSPAAYAAGSCEEKLKEVLNRALAVSGTGGVILYASCMEVITRLDFERLRDSLDNPGKIPVEILYRGPMVARFQKPKQRLAQILESMPESGQIILPGRWELPPVLPDFAGIAECLQNRETYNFLVGAGGCTGCMTAHLQSEEAYHLRKSRLNDLEAAMGCEELLCEGIAKDVREYSVDRICLLGTAVPRILSLDYGQICRELEQKGYICTYLESDGFHSAAQGIAQAYLKLGKQWIQKKIVQEKRIGVLGAHPLHCADRQRLSHAVWHLETAGWRVCFPESGFENGFSDLGSARMNWVISAEGIPLALWLWENLGIPCKVGFPVGRQAMQIWKHCFLEQEADSEVALPPRTGRKALLVGDPVVMEGIRRFLLTEKGFEHVICAVYAPLPSMKVWYQEVLEGVKGCWLGVRPGEFRYFEDRSQLQDLQKQADVIIGDALYWKREAWAKEKICIHVPEPLVSRGIVNPSDGSEEQEPQMDSVPELFGMRGAAWLNSCLDPF